MIRDGVHTIPVPAGWSVEQAWEAIVRQDKLPKSGDGRGYTWANIRVENGERVAL